MATATVERTRETDSPAQAEGPHVGEDGHPVKSHMGVAYSTKPYPEKERPLYWNPIYPGCEMSWRAEKPNRFGFFPIVQKEAWTDGAFRPRNAWEEHMTREWMMQSLEGCNDPDRWKGNNHFDGPEGEWRCQCTWHCGNGHAFRAHLRYLRHTEATTY